MRRENKGLSLIFAFDFNGANNILQKDLNTEKGLKQIQDKFDEWEKTNMKDKARCIRLRSALNKSLGIIGALATMAALNKATDAIIDIARRAKQGEELTEMDHEIMVEATRGLGTNAFIGIMGALFPDRYAE